MEAAHVRMVKRGVEQVSLVGYEDDYKTQHVCSKYSHPDPGSNYAGYCTIECCDSKTEEMCYEYDDVYNQYCKAVRRSCP
jgi:hypothetical protein